MLQKILNNEYIEKKLYCYLNNSIHLINVVYLYVNVDYYNFVKFRIFIDGTIEIETTEVEQKTHLIDYNEDDEINFREQIIPFIDIDKYVLLPKIIKGVIGL